MSKEVKVTICPPGVAEGAYFQRFSMDRNFGRFNPTEANPTGETPGSITLGEYFSVSAMSLREIAEQGDD